MDTTTHPIARWGRRPPTRSGLTNPARSSSGGRARAGTLVTWSWRHEPAADRDPSSRVRAAIRPAHLALALLPRGGFRGRHLVRARRDLRGRAGRRQSDPVSAQGVGVADLGRAVAVAARR